MAEHEDGATEEMEQLLNMGFPPELASQALTATGGKSTIEATEWILLSQSHKHKQQPSTSPNPNPSPIQPKLDRFFSSKSRSPQTPSTQNQPPHPKLNSISSSPLFHINNKRQQENGGGGGKEEEEGESSMRKRPKSLPSQQSFLLQQPLAERMRPRSIEQVLGQDHLLGNNSFLTSSLTTTSHRLPSILLWGPPGTGKTSIARAIANSPSLSLSYRFVSLSAVTSGVKDVRESVEEARKLKSKNKICSVLFIDEVHRFNKAQQDSFLPVIEDGSIVFIGATTENPSFHLITPLLSRCRVLTLRPLQPHDIVTLLKRASNDAERGLARSVAVQGVEIEVEEEVFRFLSLHCDGDARVALNALEISATTAAAREINGNKGSNTVINLNQEIGVAPCTNLVTITMDDAKEALQSKHIAYDKDGEEHYNLISALHKSMRGSDANAAIYWLARMLEGGEEPLYIARRLVRFASEDVGLADPSALNQSVACYQACHFIGMPECNVILAQCVAYLALAPKSVAVYQAIGAAQKAVKESAGQNEAVPLHLRNAPTKLMKEIGYGKGYIYPPSDPSSASAQSYLPLSLQGYKFLNWPN